MPRSIGTRTVRSSPTSGSYLDLLLGSDSNFSLIQAQHLQVGVLVIFISSESLMFLVFFFFFFNLMPDPLRIEFCVVLFNTSLCFKSHACVLFDFSLSIDPKKSSIQYSQPRVIWFHYKMIQIKNIWNVYPTYNRFIKYGFRRGGDRSFANPKIRSCPTWIYVNGGSHATLA
jgi:hypothetical protein